MTAVADTRLLLTFKFPPTEVVRRKVAGLMDESLRRELLLPSIVIAEFIKVAGRRVGEEAALTFLEELKARGAAITVIDESIAVEAGKLALRHWGIPIADALIGAAMIVRRAEYIVSDDPHFKQMKLNVKWL